MEKFPFLASFSIFNKLPNKQHSQEPKTKNQNSKQPNPKQHNPKQQYPIPQTSLQPQTHTQNLTKMSSTTNYNCRKGCNQRFSTYVDQANHERTCNAMNERFNDDQQNIPSYGAGGCPGRVAEGTCPHRDRYGNVTHRPTRQ